MTEHIEEHLPGKKWLLYADNLGSQKKRSVVKNVHTKRGKWIYGPPQRTHGWQPIDCGHLGATIKHIAKEKWEVWMDKPSDDQEGIAAGAEPRSNWDVWESGGFTASQKRILMTWIFGDSYNELISKKYYNLRRSAFEKGGVAVTSSGKNDHLIKVDNHGPVWPAAPGYVSE